MPDEKLHSGQYRLAIYEYLESQGIKLNPEQHSQVKGLVNKYVDAVTKFARSKQGKKFEHLFTCIKCKNSQSRSKNFKKTATRRGDIVESKDISNDSASEVPEQNGS